MKAGPFLNLFLGRVSRWCRGQLCASNANPAGPRPTDPLLQSLGCGAAEQGIQKLKMVGPFLGLFLGLGLVCSASDAVMLGC